MYTKEWTERKPILLVARCWCCCCCLKPAHEFQIHSACIVILSVIGNVPVLSSALWRCSQLWLSCRASDAFKRWCFPASPRFTGPTTTSYWPSSGQTWRGHCRQQRLMSHRQVYMEAFMTTEMNIKSILQLRDTWWWKQRRCFLA